MFEKHLSERMGCGEIKFRPFVSLSDSESCGKYCEISGNKTYKIFCECESYNDVLYITECAGGYTVKRVFKNTSGKIMHLRELGVRLNGISFGGDSKDNYYYHVENPRVFGVLTIPIKFDRLNADVEDSEFDEDAGNKWTDKTVITKRVGTSPYQPFPAILLSNLAVKHGLVHGTLSQKVFYHNYFMSGSVDTVEMRIYSSFKDIAYRELSPSEVLVDEWYLGRAEHADDYDRIFEDYCLELRKKLPANYGASNINRDNMVWGTWNDGVFRSVNEELVLTEAKELVEHFPNVRWLQIDDGYCALDKKMAHGLGVPYEGEAGVSKEKFPHGMRFVSDKIREIGLRPALWIGGACPAESKISQEWPEIMLDYLFRRKYNSCVIDVSIPEAREYMTSALNTLILDWGFDGVKHDFWSYAFESSEPILRNKNASGYEHRSWWLSEIRKRLPTDGYLQTGCDIVMGNPFLGTHFTNYRYGIDIGSGKWSNIKTNFLWGVACFATHTGDLIVPNSDSVGMFPGLSDIDAEFCINFILITRTMVELAGVFSKVDKTSKRFAMLKKATCNVNNGQDVYLAGYDYRTAKNTPPEKLYIKTPHFSKESADGVPKLTLAMFNIEEEQRKTVTVVASELGLDSDKKYVVTDVWSGEQFVLFGKLEFNLAPHESRLVAISESFGVQIYDANIELKNVKSNENIISSEVCYKSSSAELILSQTPKAILFDGNEIHFTVDGCKALFEIPSKGSLDVIF